MQPQNVLIHNTNTQKHAFYNGANIVCVFVSADNLINSYVFRKHSSQIAKSKRFIFPEDYLMPQIQNILVKNSQLYCFSCQQSNNSFMSEMFVVDLQQIADQEIEGSFNSTMFQQQTIQLNRTYIKVSKNINNFSTNEDYICCISTDNNVYIYDIQTSQLLFSNQIKYQINHVTHIQQVDINNQLIFVLATKQNIILVNKNFKLTYVEPHNQQLIKDKQPDLVVNYVHCQSINQLIYVVNIDGKTIILQHNGNIAKWQNINENTTQAVTSHCVCDGIKLSIDPKPLNQSEKVDPKTTTASQEAHDAWAKQTQIVSFNNCVIKVNNSQSLKFRGKTDLSKTMSQLQNQSIVNSYIADQYVVCVTNKCHIQIMELQYNCEEKLCHIKFVACYSGLFNNDVIFTKNQLIIQHQKLLYIKQLDSNVTQIQDNLVPYCNLQYLHKNQLLYSLHKSIELPEKCKAVSPTKSQVLQNNIFVSNSQQDTQQKSLFCASCYDTISQKYRYILALEGIVDPIIQLQAVNNEYGDECEDIIVVQTNKHKLYAIYINRNQNLFFIIQLQVQANKFSLMENNLAISTISTPQISVFLFVINNNNDLIYFNLNKNTIQTNQFKSNYLTHFNNVSEVFQIKKHNQQLFIGLILVNQKDQQLQSLIYVFNLKQLTSYNLQKSNITTQSKSQNNLVAMEQMCSVTQTQFRVADILQLASSNQYDQMPVTFEVNQYYEYSCCFIAVQYQKCVKLYSMLSHEVILQKFATQQIQLTDISMIVTLQDSFQQYIIDEILMSNSTFYSYLNNNNVCKDLKDEQNIKTINQLDQFFFSKKYKKQVIQLSAVDVDLRSKITDNQVSQLQSQIKSLHTDLYELSEEKQPESKQIEMNLQKNINMDALKPGNSSNLDDFKNSQSINSPKTKSGLLQVLAQQDLQFDDFALGNDDVKKQDVKEVQKKPKQSYQKEENKILFKVLNTYPYAPIFGFRVNQEYLQDSVGLQKFTSKNNIQETEQKETQQEDIKVDEKQTDESLSYKEVKKPQIKKNQKQKKQKVEEAKLIVTSPAQLNTTTSADLIKTITNMNQNLAQTVNFFENNQNDDNSQETKNQIKQQLKLMGNTMDRIYTIFGIQDDNVQQQLKNLQETLMNFTAGFKLNSSNANNQTPQLNQVINE